MQIVILSDVSEVFAVSVFRTVNERKVFQEESR